MKLRAAALWVPVVLLTASAFVTTPPGVAQSPNGTANSSDAEITAGKKPLPGLRLELSAPRRQYSQGEPIEVTMRYTYTGERKLSVLRVTYERDAW